MIGKTNAGGGGGFAKAGDAVLRVSAPAGSTVTLTRDNIAKTGIGWLDAENTNNNVYLFSIKSAQFSNDPWTINATSGASSASLNVVINGSYIYSAVISFRIPAGYQEVAYIEADGAQYVNTGIAANTIGRGVFTGRITSASNYTSLFGATNSTSAIENVQSLAYRPSDGQFFLDNNGHMNATAIGADTDFTVDFTVSSSALNVTVNGTEASISGTVGTITSRPLWIFQNNYGGTSLAVGVHARMRGVQIYNRSDELVADYVPCYQRSDNAVGFYDIVSETFIGNSGSGSFSAGPDV